MEKLQDGQVECDTYAVDARSSLLRSLDGWTAHVACVVVVVVAAVAIACVVACWVAGACWVAAAANVVVIASLVP